jgi:hypothetical protein
MQTSHCENYENSKHNRWIFIRWLWGNFFFKKKEPASPCKSRCFSEDPLPIIPTPRPLISFCFSRLLEIVFKKL